MEKIMSAKKPTIYVLGASGFLGSECVKYLDFQGYQVLTNRIDISNYSLLKKNFGLPRPDVVVNFAGVRAYPTIDWCEDHKEETLAVNVAGAINVMLAALAADAYPIQISSGCIYSGGPDKSFTEEDEPNFYGSFYSRTRIILQKALEELPVLCARIRMPISIRPHPRNFIDKIVSYPKIISIPNSVTLIEDLWPALERLIEARTTGILNLTNEGYIEHEQILNAYREVVDTNHKYEKITLEQLEGPGGITKAKRSNCVLSMNKARGLGISMPALDEARLKEIMEKYKQSMLSSNL
jgi:dTDP-4-dehydrorhamnose reductase